MPYNARKCPCKAFKLKAVTYTTVPLRTPYRARQYPYRRFEVVVMTVHVNGGELPQKEIDLYVARANELHPGTTSIDIHVDGDYVDIGYHVMPFQRIRRITGQRLQ